jgi:hypothetical protein
MPDMTADPAIRRRTQELVTEAKIMLEAIRSLAPSKGTDSFADPVTLANAVAKGILDAPHLQNNPYACGQIETKIDERGACVAVEPGSSKSISEKERLSKLSL